MFSKLLIANRGEIALRIIRACREMGIKTVIVYSEADANSLPVALADESVCIGPASAAQSYLKAENIIGAAEITGVEAIHPGYGFLSENADFAALCKENEITFIGPDAEVIRLMGDKNNARELMNRNGIPVVPGSGVIKHGDDIKTIAAQIGYPLLVKASAGGGGKGIRLVNSEGELESAVVSASVEAASAFGNGDVFFEKYLQNVRHVEMQVIADCYGNAVCLGERDCSLQLNKQKVLEEAPCPVIDDRVRIKMNECALSIVKAAGYTNAGTVEFLLEPDGNFYFIEMNTRLQVEHPVTEETSGIDIVKWQIRSAAGMPLSFTQNEIHITGCSLECRICARSTGKVDFFHTPGGTRVRFDTSLYAGAEISQYYDPMIGKLIVYAENREQALRKMETALCEIVVEGVKTNISDQLALIRSDGFRRGEYDTAYLTEIFKVLQ